jgi:hypothetical protein
MGRLLMLSTPAKVNVAGMVVAAAGILIEYVSGVEGFPTVPPGPFILVGSAALVAWGPPGWTVAVAVFAPLLSLVLGTMSTVLHWGTTAPLSHPGETAGFVGAVLQVVGLLVALGAGIVVAVHPAQIRTGARHP